MPVNKVEAITHDHFHYHGMSRDGQPRCYNWRRNGRTQIWKSRPDDFSIPLKYGLYEYCRLEFKAAGSRSGEDATNPNWHTAESCPFHG